MQTTATETRRTGSHRLAIAALAVIGLLLGTGCEYLGLESSGGSSGSSQKSGQKKKKESGGGGEAGDDKKGGASGKKAAKKDDKKKKKQKDDGADEKKQKDKPPELAKPSGESGEPKEKKARRNPFASDLEQTEEDDEQSDEPETKMRNRGPLEQHPYKKYRLSAIISQVAVPKAMFIAPDQKGHVVREGDKLGKEGGVIKDVRDNAVVLEIPPEGENGSPRSATIKLRQVALPTEDEGELNEEEKETLRRLLKSKEGREAVRESYQKAAPGAAASEKNRQQGESTSRSESDDRFPGLAPPE